MNIISTSRQNIHTESPVSRFKVFCFCFLFCFFYLVVFIIIIIVQGALEA